MQHRVVLGGATLVTEQRTDGGEDGRHDCDLRREIVAAVARVLNGMIVRPMDVKMISGHAYSV
ncbi:hypothetical protein GCM10025771_23010 [Niveibacterium umoris]